VLPDGDDILLGDLDCDATVLRIDRTTGAVVWRTGVLTVPYECRAPIPGLESSPPPLAVEGDDAVVFALGGLVVKLDAASGVERWRRQIDAGPLDTFLNALLVDRPAAWRSPESSFGNQANRSTTSSSRASTAPREPSAGGSSGTARRALPIPTTRTGTTPRTRRPRWPSTVRAT
jgi:hypothetical protein